MDKTSFVEPPGADVQLTDEEEAARAREEYRLHGIAPAPPDPLIAALLESGETLFARRDEASLGRLDEETGSVVREEGSLYVTSRRLIHLGAIPRSFQLAEIEELAMADDRLLVTLVGSTGITLDAENPRLLRVLIAAAKAAMRSET